MEYCQCCGRHCPMDNLSCERGRAYAARKSQNDFGEQENEQENGLTERMNKITEEREKIYNTLDVNTKLIFNLRDSGHTVRALSDGKASQSRILILIRECEKMTQRELTERVGVQSGTVSEVLSKLEKAGLLVRTESAEDKRTSELTLTHEGEIAASDAIAERSGRNEDMFSCLTDDEKAELLMLLEKVNSDWRIKYPFGRGRHERGEHGRGRFGHEHGGHGFGGHEHGGHEHGGHEHGGHGRGRNSDINKDED